MRLIKFLSVAFSIALLAACNQSNGWKLLTTFNGGNAYYFISNDHSYSKDEASIQLIYDEPQNLNIQGNSSVTYTSKESTIIFECPTKTFIMPDYSYHNKSTVVHWVSIPPNEVIHNEIKNDDIALKLIEKLNPTCIK